VGRLAVKLAAMLQGYVDAKDEGRDENLRVADEGDG
jgi:hypothetical protein